MPTLLQSFIFVLLVIETLIGMMGNGFIVIVNCVDWFRSRKLSPADMILSCLGFFRFLFHAVVIHYAISILFFMKTDQFKHLKVAHYISWSFINTAVLWLGTWLSVLYCVKIANLSHPLFLQMKRRFPGLLPWLLLGTVVFSAIITIATGTSNANVSKCNSFESLLTNNSHSGNEIFNSCKYLLLLYVVPNFLPFMIFLSSSILLLTSLWCHKKLLQNNAKDVSTEAHRNAIKALASFFILLFINPKLKQESIKMLHQLKC
ncbi:taste receptor type 2 member 41-like [Podarcis raffonei]|uniref:taste receptor type 2 member 41-like n=1 Tax=Podarcis raffonei TaxID=65483 RepID=UPI0023291481|nr:taste receptor type 2 member 41-like [Podarcis raffonei]